MGSIAARLRAGGSTSERRRRRLLSVYLNDHAAISVVAVELARRAAAGNAGTAFGEHTARLARDLEVHRDALDRLMGAFGVRRNALKLRGAWLGERAGRLKLNGSLTSKSPLSPVVEAEGLLASVGAFAVLWRGMATLPDPQIAATVDCDALAASATDELSELERQRLELLRTAIAA